MLTYLQSFVLKMENFENVKNSGIAEHWRNRQSRLALSITSSTLRGVLSARVVACDGSLST